MTRPPPRPNRPVRVSVPAPFFTILLAGTLNKDCGSKMALTVASPVRLKFTAFLAGPPG